ncbi:hypothetical protein MRX96_034441 [Rhipicephalus microplus]
MGGGELFFECRAIKQRAKSNKKTGGGFLCACGNQLPEGKLAQGLNKQAAKIFPSTPLRPAFEPRSVQNPNAQGQAQRRHDKRPACVRRCEHTRRSLSARGLGRGSRASTTGECVGHAQQQELGGRP